MPEFIESDAFFKYSLVSLDQILTVKRQVDNVRSSLFLSVHLNSNLLRTDIFYFLNRCFPDHYNLKRLRCRIKRYLLYIYFNNTHICISVLIFSQTSLYVSRNPKIDHIWTSDFHFFALTTIVFISLYL